MACRTRRCTDNTMIHWGGIYKTASTGIAMTRTAIDCGWVRDMVDGFTLHRSRANCRIAISTVATGTARRNTGMVHRPGSKTARSDRAGVALFAGSRGGNVV